jgi:TRAP-type mannitol/chloroaromatic compound transport system substrate-binding protein
MKTFSGMKHFAVLTTVAVAAALTAPQALAEDKPVRWNMQSWFPAKLPLAGTMGKEIERKLRLVSGGNIQIRFNEPGALVAPPQCFDSVASGAIQACWSTPAYWHGKDPTFSIFSAVPFGPEWPELLAWFYSGGGRELYEELYHKHNIHAMPCGGMVPEASGWFKKDVKSIADLKGLKMRILGLGGSVAEKFGVSTQLLPGGDVYPALELGTIDAAEFAAPSVDLALGFHEVAKLYYFPGWHQPATFYDLMLNKKNWDGLSKTQQAQIEIVCGDNVRQLIAEGEASQSKAIKALKAKGVDVRTWAKQDLNELHAAWLKVAAEYSAKNPGFKKAWESMQAFRTDYKVWKDLQDLDKLR